MSGLPPTGPSLADPGASYLEACSICGDRLDYRERASLLRCTLCGREETGHVVCSAGHYVCDTCHGAGFVERLGPYLAASHETSPHRLAEELLDQPGLPMLGCEHAQIAAGSVMTGLRNRGDLGVTQTHVDEALERTRRQAVGAYCGLTGVCGIVPALGACASVLTGAQCGKGPQTKEVMQLVSRLAAVTAAEAEPGCCKAYLRSGLREFATFAEERLGLRLPPPDPVVCMDMERHPHGCRGPACAYHPEHADGGPAPWSPIRLEPNMVSTAPAGQARYDDFFAITYAPGALDVKTKILVALGASLASGCAP